MFIYMKSICTYMYMYLKFIIHAVMTCAMDVVLGTSYVTPEQSFICRCYSNKLKGWDEDFGKCPHKIEVSLGS